MQGLVLLDFLASPFTFYFYLFFFWVKHKDLPKCFEKYQITYKNTAPASYIMLNINSV